MIQQGNFTQNKSKAIRKPRKSPERDLQIACVTYLRMQYGDKLFFFHSPNGGKRNKIEAALFKAMGVLKGLPDLVMLTPFTIKGVTSAGLAIELKSKGRKTEKDGDQQKVLNRLGLLNYVTAEIDSLDAFIEVINKHYSYLKHSKTQINTAI